MEFYSLAGHMALGSRLRRLSEWITNDAERVYELYGTKIDPRWFPVFYMLTTKEEAGITELAEDIGQSHAAVSQVVRDMIKAGVVDTYKCSKDGRVSKVTLTQKGKDLAPNLPLQCNDVSLAVSNVFSDAGSNLWAEIEALEYELNLKSLYSRVCDIRKSHESKTIEIVAYTPEHQQAFIQLNEAWIKKYWKMEDSDYKALDEPTENIIDKGGYIGMAMKHQQVVGTCALIDMGNRNYELAKMAVDDKAKGLGIGFMLGKHIVEKAVSMGANRIYLESNTILKPAINLYRKLGFKRIPFKKSPYERCNIRMELLL